MAEQGLNEIMAVARARGIVLPGDAIIEFFDNE
jgi:hypothetical protein